MVQGAGGERMKEEGDAGGFRSEQGDRQDEGRKVEGSGGLGRSVAGVEGGGGFSGKLARGGCSHRRTV